MKQSTIDKITNIFKKHEGIIRKSVAGNYEVPLDHQKRQGRNRNIDDILKSHKKAHVKVNMYSTQVKPTIANDSNSVGSPTDIESPIPHIMNSTFGGSTYAVDQ